MKKNLLKYSVIISKGYINCFEIFREFIILSSDDFTIKILNNTNYEFIKSIKIDSEILCLLTLTVKNFLVAGLSNGYIIIFDINNNFFEKKIIKEHKGNVWKIINFNNILISSSDNSIRLFSILNNFIVLKIINSHIDEVLCIAANMIIRKILK